jgi:LmeA-like phospholipid-binding
MAPSATADRSGGPVLALLSKGLELWLRRQCEEVDTLELQLEGAMAQWLQGNLQGVRLRARRVVFQNLCLEQVDLASEPIRLKLPGLLRQQPLQLDQPFRVRGSVVFSEEGLSRSLTRPEGQELADLLCQGLQGGGTLQGAQLQEGRLILQLVPPQGGQPEARHTHVVLSATGLQVAPLQGGPPVAIPLDAAITLERAEVRDGRLELAGVALVQP